MASTVLASNWSRFKQLAGEGQGTSSGPWRITTPRTLGVEHFGQTGTIAELYRHYGIDTQSIIAAGETVSSGRPIHQFKLMA
jgi:pyruvate dehydrogenase complex dehydrogenase (E1) component